MSRQLHIAVLECDTPVAPVLASRGTYGDIFQQLLDEGLSSLGLSGRGVQFRISKWDVVIAQSYPDLSEVDALLISGSSKPSYFPFQPTFSSLCKNTLLMITSRGS